MHKTSGATDRESELLKEIGALSDRVRGLRAASAAANGPQIKALEAQSRSKWEELRARRATPDGVPPSTTGRGIWG